MIGLIRVLRETVGFPTFHVCASAVLVIAGLWIFLRRSRPRAGSEPRCHRCEYILIGLTGGRCPECGTVVDRVKSRRGRRGGILKGAVGVALISVAMVVSWRPVRQWASSVEWYQYRPTFLVMSDLEDATGQSERLGTWTNARLEIAITAHEELLRRDRLGALSPKYRRKLDEMGLRAFLSNNVPLANFVNFDIADRLVAGRLTPEQEAKIYSQAVSVSLSVVPNEMWLRDDTPVRLSFRMSLPYGVIADVKANTKSVRVDGKAFHWSRYDPRRVSDTADVYSDANVDRLLSYGVPGRHSIQVDTAVEIRIREHPTSTALKPVYRQTITLKTNFVHVDPKPWTRVARFALDPWDEGARYLPKAWMKRGADCGIYAIRDLSISEMIRRDDFGLLTSGDRDAVVARILDIQKARSEPWNSAYGDYLEDLRVRHQLTEESWRRYGAEQLRYYLRVRPKVRQGDVLPIDIVEAARRGNSLVPAFEASQWKMDYSFWGGVPKPWRMRFWEDWDYIGVPREDAGFPRGSSEFPSRHFAELNGAPAGRYALRMKIKDYDLTWTERPLGVVVPTEFDLGQVPFEILPGGVDTVVPVDGPGIEGLVKQCLDVELPMRSKDGSLAFRIIIHNAPVDLAFHVSIVAGGREWQVGKLFAPKGGDSDQSYSYFDVPDARQMPASGLTLKFTPDPDVARRTTLLKEYWNKEVLIRGISIDQDEYLKSKGKVQ